MFNINNDLGVVVGHRGASASAPENTIAAFDLAIEQQVTWIEIDVSTLGDGTPIILHDATVDRCSDTVASIEDLTQGDLISIDAGSWFDKKYEGQSIPFFDDVLKWLRQHQLCINLEIKRHPHQVNTRKFIDPILEVLAGYSDIWDRLLITSFDNDSLKECYQFDARLHLGLLYEEPPSNWISEAKNFNAKDMHLNYKYLSREILKQASDNNIHVRCYTVDSTAFCDYWFPLGLTGVIVNDPILFMQHISSISTETSVVSG